MSKVTIVDVAARAGVSLTTVSRVLNGNYPVKNSTADKVRKAIRELNYEPDAVARSLKNKKTWLIGVVVPDISNPFFTQMIKGIELAAEKEGYSILVASTYEHPEKERSIIRRLAQRQIDAMIISTCQTEEEAFRRSIRGVAAVLADRRAVGAGLSTVAEDNRASAYKAVEPLIQNGHRKIAIVNGNLKVSIARERYEGYLEAMADYGLTVEPCRVLDCSISKYGTQTAVESIIRNAFQQDKPTAVFSTNNTRTQAVINACRQLGLSIPKDLSLVSYGEIPNLFTDLQITHIEQDAVQMGKKAGEAALRLITEPPNGRFCETILNFPLVLGNSVHSIIADGMAPALP